MVLRKAMEGNHVSRPRRPLLSCSCFCSPFHAERDLNIDVGSIVLSPLRLLLKVVTTSKVRKH